MWEITATQIGPRQIIVFSGLENDCKKIFGFYEDWNATNAENKQVLKTLSDLLKSAGVDHPARWAKPVRLIDSNGMVIKEISYEL